MEIKNKKSVRGVPPTLWNQSIEVLKLKDSIEFRLQQSKVFTIGDLDKLTDSDLLMINRVGTKSIKEIKAKLKLYIKSYLDFRNNQQTDDANLVLRIVKISQIFTEHPEILNDIDAIITKYLVE